MKRVCLIFILLVVPFSLISMNKSPVSAQEIKEKGPEGCFRERENFFSLYKAYLEHEKPTSSEASQAFDKAMKAKRKYFNCMRYYAVPGWKADEIIQMIMDYAKEQQK